MDEKDWYNFVNAVLHRLEAGASEYGDKSFSKSPDLLLAEIEEEVLDIAGWAFIMWCRIIQLKKETKNIPSKLSPNSYVVSMIRSYFKTDKDIN